MDNNSDKVQEEYVNQEELDQLETPEGEPLYIDDNDLKNIDAALSKKDEDGEDSVSNEEVSADNIGATSAEVLRSALQGGGDDKDDE
jgi:hypothetical protein